MKMKIINFKGFIKKISKNDTMNESQLQKIINTLCNPEILKYIQIKDL